MAKLSIYLLSLAIPMIPASYLLGKMVQHGHFFGMAKLILVNKIVFQVGWDRLEAISEQNIFHLWSLNKGPYGKHWHHLFQNWSAYFLAIHYAVLHWFHALWCSLFWIRQIQKYLGRYKYPKQQQTTPNNSKQVQTNLNQWWMTQIYRYKYRKPPQTT